MADRTITLDDLACEMGEHLEETDAAYVAETAAKVLPGEFKALSDGDTIRHQGVKMSVASVIDDITSAVCSMEPARAAAFANELLSGGYEANAAGEIEVTFAPDDAPAP